MKAALLSKAALCICPPAIVATTAAYVPPVRAAIHHATRPHAKPVAHARPQSVSAVKGGPCAPGFVATPLIPLSTFAAPVPPDALSSSNPFLGAVAFPGVGVSGFGGGGGGGATGGGGAPTPPVTAVPEPTTWSLMLIGFGLLGGALRSRRSKPSTATRRSTRRSGVAGAGLMLGGLEPVQAMTTAASVGSKSTLLVKAVMCVCPPAMMVATVAAVPQARKAVYAATMPREAAPRIAPSSVVPPCDPTLAGLAAS
jgi:hypothetical protein